MLLWGEEVVSVVIPVYNGEEYVEHCVLSVLNQTYPDLEIIIVDDGSIDNTFKICSNLQAMDERIKLYKNDANMGLPHSRDIGISESKGEFITFVDADDYLPQDSIEVRVNNIGNCDMVMGNYTILTEEVSELGYSLSEAITISAYEVFRHFFLDKEYGFVGFRWNKLFRKSILNGIDYNNDEIYYNEDRLFVCLYLLNCNSVRIIPNDVYFYIKRKGSMTKQKGFTKSLLTGLKGFSEMKDALYSKYRFAYYMCCLNAYHTSKSIYLDTPDNDIESIGYLKEQMSQNRKDLLSYYNDKKLSADERDSLDKRIGDRFND